MKDPARIYAPEQVEELTEARLTKTYGKAHENVTPGLKWLFGTSSYPYYFDHPEYRMKDGKKTMIARPYGIELEGLQELVNLAYKKQLELSIDTPSNYNYKTLLVILTEWTSSELNH